MMTVQDTVEIEICVDCLMMSANGLHGWEYDENWLKAYNSAVSEYGTEPVPNCGENCEGGFSWDPCDFCNSPLGGDRHPAVLSPR